MSAKYSEAAKKAFPTPLRSEFRTSYDFLQAYEKMHRARTSFDISNNSRVIGDYRTIDEIYPEPKRENFFDDEGYNAAVKRIAEKRASYIKLNKLEAGVKIPSRKDIESIILSPKKFAPVKESLGKGRRIVKVEIDGILYPSAAAAGKAMQEPAWELVKKIKMKVEGYENCRIIEAE